MEKIVDMKKVNRKGSRYYKTPEGDMESVTSIIKLKDKPALVQWAANCCAEAMASDIENHLISFKNGNASVDDIRECLMSNRFAYKQSQQKACNNGTAVHDAIEQYLKKGEMPKGLKKGSEVANGFRAFLLWAKDANFTAQEVEIPLYSKKFRYAGRLDVTGKINDKLYVVDFKTSKDFYFDYPIQLAAYAKAYEELYNEKIDGIAVLRLDKVTGMPFFRDYSELIDQYFDVFLGLNQTFKAEQGIKKILSEKINL